MSPDGGSHVEAGTARVLCDLALGSPVVESPEARDGDVLLGQGHEEALHATRAPDQ